MMLRKFRHTYFVVALILAANFTACNDNEPAEEGSQVPVQISAGIASNNAVESREDAYVSVSWWEKNEFEENDKINVDAWHFHHDSNGVRQSETKFFDNQEITYDGSSWVYTPVKYWPNVADEKLAVCAYLVCPSITSKYSEEKDNVTTYYPHCEVEVDQENGYTMTFSKCGLIDDILVTPLTEVSRSELVEGKIPLTFYHILAQIKVRVRYIATEGSAAEDNYMTIKRVELNYYSDAGTFTGFADVNGVPTAQWSGVNLNGNSLYDGKEYTVVAGEEFMYLDEMKFCQIPFKSPTYDAQEGENRYSTLEFYVTYDNETNYPQLSIGDPDNDGDTDYINALSYKKEVEFTLQPGKTTTFDVTFNGKDIVVEVSEADGYIDWSGDGTYKDEGEDLVVDF